MWKCPKCGRSFSREGQPLYCGKIETIDQYIEEQDESVKPYLNEVKQIKTRGYTRSEGEDFLEYADVLEGSQYHIFRSI